MKSSTVILGFDALDFKYLNEFEETLPNFSLLRSEGLEAPLQSTFPPWTGSAWPSAYTGVDPSRHGVFGFFDYADHGYPDEVELVSRENVGVPALWDYLSARDVPSVVLNVPVTHPAYPIVGVLVPGYLAPEDASGYPDGIRQELSRRIGTDYRIYSEYEVADRSSEKLSDYVRLLRMRKEAASYLLEAYDWRVAFVQIQKTDAVFHDFSDRKAFRRVYRTADEVLGAVRRVAAETSESVNTIVCSDHGIGPTTGYKVNLNEILKRNGYVVGGGDGGASVDLPSEKRDLLGGRDATGFKASVSGELVGKVTRVLRRFGVSPGQVYALLDRLGVAEYLVRAVPESAIDAVGEEVDWHSSRAYCRGSVELGVRINLQGREPDGVVPEDEYEALRTELVRLLSSLRTPSNEAVFEFVKRREEVYDGPFAENAPDVLFKPRDMNHVIGRGLVGKRFLPVDTYEHDERGVFVGAGPAFERSASVDSLSLVDVAPITLATLGLPVPERMTGSVPTGLLRRDVSVAEYDVEDFGTGRGTDEPGEQVEEFLSNLGYLS